MEDHIQSTELTVMGVLDSLSEVMGDYNHELLSRLEMVLAEASREPLFLSLDEEDRVALRRFINDITHADPDKGIEVTMGFEIGYRYALLFGKLRQMNRGRLQDSDNHNGHNGRNGMSVWDRIVGRNEKAR